MTRADVEAAQQQAAAIIGARIDAMTAGEVNTIAKKFLPTMGMKPTMSKANNKAAMTDPKTNLEAAAADVGATLPAEVTRALQADMEGRVADAQSANENTAQSQQTEPNPLERTPKQYADAWLRWSAERNGLPLSEVREMHGDEAGLKAIEQRWVDAVVQDAKSGQPLPAKTLDKLLEVRPNTVLPESAIPAGYQRPEARKAEKEEAAARKEKPPARTQKAQAAIDSGADAQGQDVMFSRTSDTDTQAQRQFKETERAYGGREAYDRAKKDGKTKLTYGQWVQVRTPNFIRWFGDHVIASAAPQRQASNFTQAREQAKAFQGKRLTNPASGVVATVSRNNLDKMLSEKAVGKSETAALHSVAVANLDGLFDRAILGWSKPDANGDPNIKAIHRFFAPMLVDGNARLVKMTVKETIDQNHTNPLYTVEAVEFNEKSPAAQWVDASASADGVDLTSIRSAGDAQSLAQRVQDFNTATVSKVVDPDTGEPLVVYHGTGKDFTEFQEGKRQSQYGGGLYFGRDPKVASSFASPLRGPAPNVMPVYLRTS